MTPRGFLVVSCLLSLSTRPGFGAASVETKPPNIVLILTDDQDSESMSHLPRIKQLLTDQGATFSNYFVSDSLCSPSRSTLLTGQYAHNHEVVSNRAPDGGFDRFRDLGHEASTIATWLKGAGYRTGLFGKYINGYPGSAGSGYVPPGWDTWVSPVGGDFYGQYDYELNENGHVMSHGSSARDYLGDVLTAGAVRFIRANVGNPFFLYVAPVSPHIPATPPRRYRRAFRHQAIPRTPSFDERDVSDKPAWLMERPLLTTGQIRGCDRLYRRRLQSLLGVEDMVGKTIRALEETGQMETTYVFFVSDNGFHYGQHRLLPAKGSAYEEDIRVPLVIRGPGIAPGRVIRQLAVNADLAPTIAELAGAPVPPTVDGRSLVPLLAPAAATDWRRYVLVEHMRDGSTSGRDRDDETSPSARPPLFFGIREPGMVYVEYSTSEREMYDLASDPYELTNLIEDSPDGAHQPVVQAFSTVLTRLRACAGASCRQADGDQ